MKLINFTDIHGQPVAIVADKITGFVNCEERAGGCGSTFIATGADGANGEENGWYEAENFSTVTAILQSN